MRKKHRNDQNHGKNGLIGGNPRYGRRRGHRRGQAPADKRAARKTMADGFSESRADIARGGTY